MGAGQNATLCSILDLLGTEFTQCRCGRLPLGNSWGLLSQQALSPQTLILPVMSKGRGTRVAHQSLLPWREIQQFSYLVGAPGLVHLYSCCQFKTRLFCAPRQVNLHAGSSVWLLPSRVCSVMWGVHYSVSLSHDSVWCLICSETVQFPEVVFQRMLCMQMLCVYQKRGIQSLPILLSRIL